MDNKDILLKLLDENKQLNEKVKNIKIRINIKLRIK